MFNNTLIQRAAPTRNAHLLGLSPRDWQVTLAGAELTGWPAYIGRWQITQNALRRPWHSAGVLRLRHACERADALLPRGLFRRYALSIALVAAK